MHRGGDDIRRSAAHPRRPARPHRIAPPPRPAVPAEADVSTARDGRPLWVDDPTFNIDYHVRHTALPQPGGIEQLRLLTGRIFSQRLDRTKPLWELWLVQGLEDNRFAVISKTHHSLVDGVSGRPHDRPVRRFAHAVGARRRGLDPEPEPSQASLVAAGVRGIAGTPIGLARRAIRVARRPKQTAAEVVEAAEGLGEVTWSFVNPPPSTPLNVPIGPHRRALAPVPARRPQDDQERARRHRERRLPDDRHRRAAAVAPQPRRTYGGLGAARHRARVDPRR